MNLGDKKGKLVIISSPSGGGKDAVIRQLLKIVPNSARLTTTTTRLPRPKEKKGVDYYFTTRKKFEKKIQDGEILEYAEYAGNYYGSEKKRVEKLLNNFAVVFTNIDVRGKKNMTKLNIPHISLFLMPDNLDTLKKRIERRGGVTPESLKKRLEIAKNEIEEADTYDYKVINHEGKMAETVAEVAKILRRERNRANILTKNVK